MVVTLQLLGVQPPLVVAVVQRPTEFLEGLAVALVVMDQLPEEQELLGKASKAVTMLTVLRVLEAVGLVKLDLMGHQPCLLVAVMV
jgi:hypothetical protein